MNHSVEGLYPFLMKKGAFLRHNEQILSFIDLSFSFFAEIFPVSLRTELTDSNYKHKHLYQLTMKKYYLLSLISAFFDWSNLYSGTSPKQKSGENTLPQKSELFVSLPDYCPTPDGMAIAPNGDLFWHVPILQIHTACLPDAYY